MIKVGGVRNGEELLKVTSNMNTNGFLVRNEVSIKIKDMNDFYHMFDVSHLVEELSIFVLILQPFDMIILFPK